MIRTQLIYFAKVFISELRETLKTLPKKKHDEKLCIKNDKTKHNLRYYSSDGKSNKRKYLSLEDMEQVKSLAQQDYHCEVESNALELISILEKFVLKLEACKDPEEVYKALPEARKALVTKLVTANITRWKDKYKKLPRDLPIMLWDTVKEDNKIEACDGTWVKSKTEALIIKVCIELGIPYIYEYPLKANGWWYFPDFRILNKRTGKEYIYEHFGKIDDPNYLIKNLSKKLRDYSIEGIEFGTELVCTLETQDQPLNERELKKFMKKHFL